MTTRNLISYIVEKGNKEGLNASSKETKIEKIKLSSEAENQLNDYYYYGEWGMMKPVEKVTEYPSGVLANRRLRFRLCSYVLKRLNS